MEIRKHVESRSQFFLDLALSIFLGNTLVRDVKEQNARDIVLRHIINGRYMAEGSRKSIINGRGRHMLRLGGGGEAYWEIAPVKSFSQKLKANMQF